MSTTKMTSRNCGLFVESETQTCGTEFKFDRNPKFGNLPVNFMYLFMYL